MKIELFKGTHFFYRVFIYSPCKWWHRKYIINVDRTFIPELSIRGTTYSFYRVFIIKSRSLAYARNQAKCFIRNDTNYHSFKEYSFERDKR